MTFDGYGCATHAQNVVALIGIAGTSYALYLHVKTIGWLLGAAFNVATFGLRR